MSIAARRNPTCWEGRSRRVEAGVVVGRGIQVGPETTQGGSSLPPRLATPPPVLGAGGREHSNFAWEERPQDIARRSIACKKSKAAPAPCWRRKDRRCEASLAARAWAAAGERGGRARPCRRRSDNGPTETQGEAGVWETATSNGEEGQKDAREEVGDVRTKVGDTGEGVPHRSPERR